MSVCSPEICILHDTSSTKTSATASLASLVLSLRCPQSSPQQTLTFPYCSSTDSPQYSSHPTYVLPSQPSHLVVSTHPMITRAKSSIYKQKTYLTVTQDLEPINVKVVLVDPRWHQAMKEEFQAL